MIKISTLLFIRENLASGTTKEQIIDLQKWLTDEKQVLEKTFRGFEAKPSPTLVKLALKNAGIAHS